MTNLQLIGCIVIVCIVLYAIIAFLQDNKPFIVCLIIGVLMLTTSLLSDQIPEIWKKIIDESENLSILQTNKGVSNTPTPVPTPTPSLSSSDEMVTLSAGIQVPASDFLFPESINEILTEERMNQVLKKGALNKIDMNLRSQMAINEILARYGYEFTRQDTKSEEQAREKFYGKEWYQELRGSYPSSIEKLQEFHFTEAEKANFEALIKWQEKNNVDFYVGLDGTVFRD